MAKKRNLIADYLVYLIVRAVVAFIQALPIEVAYDLAWALAVVIHRVDRRHRRIASENLMHAFGNTLNDRERNGLVFRIYEHFMRVIVEMAHIPRKMHVTNWKKFARLDNVEEAVRAILGDRGRPKIIVTAHFGNWEMAGYLLAAIGIKSHAIARDLDNPYLHRFLLRFREWSGQTILSKNGDFDRIQGVMTNNGVLISVGDQSAGPRGYFVDFFGRPASAHKAIAILSLQYNAQVIVGFGFRDEAHFHYSVGCSRVLDPADYQHRPNGAFIMTQDITNLLEETIRQAPDQYLWLHNRWKHQPKAKTTRLAA